MEIKEQKQIYYKCFDGNGSDIGEINESSPNKWGFTTYPNVAFNSELLREIADKLQEMNLERE